MVAASLLGPLLTAFKGSAAIKAAGVTAAAVASSYDGGNYDVAGFGGGATQEHGDHVDAGGEHEHDSHDHGEHEDHDEGEAGHEPHENEHEDHDDHAEHEDNEEEHEGHEEQEDADDHEELEQTDDVAEEVQVTHGVVTPGRRANKTSEEDKKREDDELEQEMEAFQEILKAVATASVVASATSRLVECRTRDLGMPWYVGRSCGTTSSLGAGASNRPQWTARGHSESIPSVEHLRRAI